jgi:hypothetical protein
MSSIYNPKRAKIDQCNGTSTNGTNAALSTAKGPIDDGADTRRGMKDRTTVCGHNHSLNRGLHDLFLGECPMSDVELVASAMLSPDMSRLIMCKTRRAR